jgi:tetratricopeptide (TPR) repeat protein
MAFQLKNLKFDFSKIFNFDKLFTTKIRKSDIKKNVLKDFALLLRHFVIEHKNAVIVALGIFLIILIAIPLYLNSYEKKVNEANKYFEAGLGAYRKAILEKELSNEERISLMQQSINTFQYVIDQYKNTPPAADALFYQANIYYDLNDFNNALKKYQEYFEKYKRSYFADYALLNIGKCYEQLNNFQGAINAYTELLKKYKKRNNVPSAMFNLAKIYELSNNFNEAFKYYNQLISQYPYSSWAYEAKLRVLFIQSLSQSQSRLQKK